MNMKTLEKNLAVEKEIEKVLEKVRPMLALHRGDVKLVRFENGVVYVELLGTCHGCALSQLTLKAGIEEMLKSSIHGIREVIAVNDQTVTHNAPGM